MTDRRDYVIRDRRRFLQTALGVGAGVMVAPATLISQSGVTAHNHAPFLTSARGLPQAPVASGANMPGTPGVHDVRSFGATGDGKTLDTSAINKAIEAASASGGGSVFFPPGSYLSYSIRLKSAVALYLDRGATILAAESPSEGGGKYDPAEANPWEQYQDFGHSHWHNSLIWGEGIDGAAILGPGLIWGKGLSKGYGPGPRAELAGVGNKAISLKNCRNVTLRDFSILQGGHFGILATGADNLVIDGVKIDTNRDGMDIDCCRNVRISNCSVNSPWDDAICLKSSFGLGYARATEDVAIANCFVTGGLELGALLDATFRKLPSDVEAFRTGRIKFGTESNGGFKNITICNCVFDSCHGLALETVDGGLLEDVSITNITMRHVMSGPIFLRLGRRLRGPQGVPIGRLRRVKISNIIASDSSMRFASILSGIPSHPIEDVSLSDIHVLCAGGGTAQEGFLQLPERENDYPEPTMFGMTSAYGFFVRHVKGLDMNHVDVSLSGPDARPTFCLDDVQGADFSHIRARHEANLPTFRLRNIEDFSLDGSWPLHDLHIDHTEEKDV
jgi:hypothetical protein